jgi:acyl-CoA synthetase (AMP-forming)/AMP-acid ligase II/3-hydroxymyristoyl/3-hydroxydecanoyl-(acyl carrier protein) dehydratase
MLADLALTAHGVITDHPLPGVRRVDPLTVPVGGDGGWSELDRRAPRLELLTSGSTGAAKGVIKTLANLEDEVADLEARWGGLIEGHEVFGTVSHQHIYGLLFRVLWPLSAGRRFRAQAFTHADELAARMSGAGPNVLVSSPTHLRRLKASQALGEVAKHCRTIFSSGSALDRATALVLHTAIGAAPLEIFGSTETGGVAWRRQDPGDGSQAWTVFPSVSADREASAGRLRVRSPFINEPAGAFTMADIVEFLDDGRFRLGARGDRTIKVGDKRLSLSEMEAAILQHSYVSEVALVVMEHPRRSRLGAVVVPSVSGRGALVRLGRRRTIQAILGALDRYWDPVLVPKIWRFVDRLPENAQGKVTMAGLTALFGRPFDPGVTMPELMAESVSERAREHTLRVPPTLGCLDGHFPGFPVVPGVAQLQWVLDVGARIVRAPLAVERIEALKFKDMLRPGQTFHLSAEVSERGDRLTFRLWNEQTLFSSGRLVLASGPTGPS